MIIESSFLMHALPDHLRQAGQDTTTSALNLIMLELALHPDVVDKMHDEVVSICGTIENPTWEHVHSLKYVACWRQHCFEMITVRVIEDKYGRCSLAMIFA